MSTEEELVAVLVDVANLRHSAQHQLGGRIDFPRLLNKVIGGRKLLSAQAYVLTPPDVNDTSFRDLLTRNGYEVHAKPLLPRANGTLRGSWEVKMAIDAVKAAQVADTVVLASGAGGFLELVQELRRGGTRVEVCAFEASTGSALREAADAFLPINNDTLIKEKLER